MRYQYIVETHSDITNAFTFKRQEAKSLNQALDLIVAEAEKDSVQIHENLYRKNFRLPSLGAFTSRLPHYDHTGKEIWGTYTIYRYPLGTNPNPFLTATN